MERLGADDAMDLAVELGYARAKYDRDKGRKVIDWADGKYGPTFDHLMPMLSRAGLLTEEAVRAYWGPGGGEAKRELEAALQALNQPVPKTARGRRSQGGSAKAS